MSLTPKMETTKKVLQNERKDQNGTVAEDEARVIPRKRPIFRRRWTSFDKKHVFFLLVLHLLCLMAPFHFTWPAFWLSILLYNITGLFGVTLSYHRNLAHKSFKLPKWLEYTFAYFGVHAFQGDPIEWVGTHRYHHQFSDTKRDPHSPTQGFWFAHIGWILDSYYLTEKVSPKDAQVFEERDPKRNLLNNIFVVHLKYGRPSNVEDLQKQYFYRFLRKTYIFHHIALALVLYALGGLPFLVWGMGVRVICVLHVTLSVNSISHMWGYQLWNTGDQSRNNWLVALLAFGEGWHNNHHAFEYSARHGLKWWEFDVTWWIILFLEAVGLATDLKLPSQYQMKKLINKPKCDHVES